MWGVRASDKAVEGLRGVRPFTCCRCDVTQLMTPKTSGAFNSYCLKDKRLDKKSKAKLALLTGKGGE